MTDNLSLDLAPLKLLVMSVTKQCPSPAGHLQADPAAPLTGTICPAWEQNPHVCTSCSHAPGRRWQWPNPLPKPAAVKVSSRNPLPEPPWTSLTCIVPAPSCFFIDSFASHPRAQARGLFLYVPVIIFELHPVVNVIISLIYVNRTLANVLGVIYE